MDLSAFQFEIGVAVALLTIVLVGKALFSSSATPVRILTFLSLFTSYLSYHLFNRVTRNASQKIHLKPTRDLHHPHSLLLLPPLLLPPLLLLLQE